MAETGRVVSADGAGSGTVTVSFVRGTACEGCRACSMGADKSEMLLTAQNMCGAKPGDEVEVVLRDGYFLRASLIMYGIPLCALVAGTALGRLFYADAARGDALSLLFGIVLMTASYLVIRRSDKRNRWRNYRPVAIRVLDGPDGDGLGHEKD